MSVRKLEIYFFTARKYLGSTAFALSRMEHPEHNWKLFTIESRDEAARFEAEDHAPDVIVSYLNPYIIPKALIAKAAGRAYNIHPAPPEYPGRDTVHFAFYDGHPVWGATLHELTEEVDAGTVLDVLETPVDRSQGVMAMRAVGHHNAFRLYQRNLPDIVAGTVARRVDRQWRLESKKTRKDFLRAVELRLDMDADEVERTIEAFFNPEYRSIFIEFHGRRFYYDPKNE